MRRITQAIVRRLPSRLRTPLSLRMQRQEQARLGREYVSAEADREDLRACTTPKQLFEYAKARFSVNQQESEIQGLLQLLAARQPEVACEIGTFRCGTLFLLTQTVKSLKYVAAIDRLFQRKEVFLATKDDMPEALFIEGYSTSARTRRRLDGFLNGQMLDFLFIDGDHTYEGCKSDYLFYRQYVRDGGLIAFHDIVPDLTTRKKSPVPLSKSEAGDVYILWSELKQQFDHHEFVDDANQDGMGIGVIEYSRQEGSANCSRSSQ